MHWVDVEAAHSEGDVLVHWVDVEAAHSQGDVLVHWVDSEVVGRGGTSTGILWHQEGGG